MQQLILIVHVLVAIAIIALVLMQHGKGADVGAAFGSGSSNTMFGSQGSMPFLMKITAVLAAIFFATSMGLSYLASQSEKQAKGLTAPVTTPTNNGTSSQQMTFPTNVAPTSNSTTKANKTTPSKK